MLRKKYKIIDGYYFDRVKIKKDIGSVCVLNDCEFCGPDEDDKFCCHIFLDLKVVTTLCGLCLSSTKESEDFSGRPKFSYIPDKRRYRLSKEKNNKKIEKI